MTNHIAGKQFTWRAKEVQPIGYRLMMTWLFISLRSACCLATTPVPRRQLLIGLQIICRGEEVWAQTSAGTAQTSPAAPGGSIAVGLIADGFRDWASPDTTEFIHWMEKSKTQIHSYENIVWVCVCVCVATELWNQQRVRWSSLCVRGRTRLLACRQALLALFTPRQQTASSLSLSFSLYLSVIELYSLISLLATFSFHHCPCCVVCHFVATCSSLYIFLPCTLILHFISHFASHSSLYPCICPFHLISCPFFSPHITNSLSPLSVPPGAQWVSLSGVQQRRPTALRPETPHARGCFSFSIKKKTRSNISVFVEGPRKQISSKSPCRIKSTLATRNKTQTNKSLYWTKFQNNT